MNAENTKARGLQQVLRCPAIAPGDTVVLKHGRRAKVVRLLAIATEPVARYAWRLIFADGRSAALAEVRAVEVGG